MSFCDHDDIWMPDKLISAIKCLKDKSSDGYSSDVYTFFNDKNKTSYYKYSYAQRKYDYFFQTAGPGCTYVFTRDLYLSFFDLIKKNDMSKIYAHDWMIYHHARRNGYSWFIDPSAHILYRQHENNEIGVNKGLLANMQRMKKVRSGWYREQILNMSSLYGDDSTLINRLRRFNIMDRILLSISVLQYRRSSYQAASLAIMILFIMK